MRTQSIDVRELPVTFNIDMVVGDDYDMEGVLKIDGVALDWDTVEDSEIAIQTQTGGAPPEVGDPDPAPVNWTFTTGPADGDFLLALTSEETTALGAETYEWYLVLKINGKVRTYFDGRLRLFRRGASG